MGRLLKRLRRSTALLVGCCLLLAVGVMAVFGPLFVSYSGTHANIALRLRAPSSANLLGTDQLGRDILTRIILGARTSLQSAALVVLFSGLVGGIIGIASGYLGRTIDTLLMRLVDFLLAFPTFLLAMGVVAILGPGLRNAIIAVSISYIGPFARLVRGVTIKVKANDYLEAAHGIGASGLRIILRHIVPNILSAITVQLTLNVGTAIVDLAGLSFLGLGAQPPAPEWGSMLSAGRPYIATAWWMTTFPGLCIMISVLACIFIGDGLRDSIDPWQQA